MAGVCAVRCAAARARGTIRRKCHARIDLTYGMLKTGAIENETAGAGKLTLTASLSPIRRRRCPRLRLQGDDSLESPNQTKKWSALGRCRGCQEAKIRFSDQPWDQ